ncbi:HesA/MoeB/ThiF family protein [Arthrobacter sp. NPDC056691]|uniref:HesA/MoeB/ThiF family protein n=1 Tax=Arthrobacter sp. NPDC056691 TaxID=3345913 RepID=UPI00366DADAF
MKWTVTMGGEHWSTLRAHLFPGDSDEHGAILRCGIGRTSTAVRLLVREVLPALDGKDYVPGTKGYRKLKADFVLDSALNFAEDQSVYLAVHCHGGHGSVAFSPTDMESHEHGYPGLLDLIGAPVVGALVFAEDAVAGDLWTSTGERFELDHLVITDPVRQVLTPAPREAPSASQEYERQARLFGDRGQEILKRQKVAVVGLGGAGSLISEQLARLGVGHLVLIDSDVVETTNLSRIVGARRTDAHPWMTDERRPRWLRQLGHHLAAKKVHVARRVARTASPDIRVDAIVSGVEEHEVAHLLRDCDHVFLSADSATARLVVNAIAHQYLIPVTQVGAKISVDKLTGDVTDVFAVSRRVGPGGACLKCNGLISPDRLREEATSAEQLDRQRYVDDAGVHAPSVITLNSVATSHAVNEWLMRITGLSKEPPEVRWFHADALNGEVLIDEPRQDPGCTQCGPSRFALGDRRRLPTKMPKVA